MPFLEDLPSNVLATLSKTAAINGISISSEASERLVDNTIRNRISRIPSEPCRHREDNPFFVADLGQVIRQHERWQLELPDVKPCYAVKCNSDKVLLRLLADLGTGFDCASVEELRQVLSLGVDPSRIVFANPCKSLPSLTFANQSGVRKTTFDNLDELDKIKTYMPNAELLLRIYANDEEALISFGKKFGASIESTGPLLSRAWELGLKVVGVSFHVGTGAADPRALETALRNAKNVLAQACELGFQANLLDVGGGFQDSNFSIMSSTIRRIIKVEFPLNTKVIAEPGRFYSRTAFSLAAKVIARRQYPGSLTPSGMLYQNDGVYGNFMNVILEKEVMSPVLLPVRQPGALPDSRKLCEHEYSIWGPTCDFTDCVSLSATFPSEIFIGDWLKYRDMGAYTNATSTQFNGFTNQHEVIYICSEPGLQGATSTTAGDTETSLTSFPEKPHLEPELSPDVKGSGTWFWTLCSRMRLLLWKASK